MSGIKKFFSRHPRLGSWAVLAIGMVALLLVTAPEDNLSLKQLLGLAAACVALAGACAWIIGWE